MPAEHDVAQRRVQTESVDRLGPRLGPEEVDVDAVWQHRDPLRRGVELVDQQPLELGRDRHDAARQPSHQGRPGALYVVGDRRDLELVAAAVRDVVHLGDHPITQQAAGDQHRHQAPAVADVQPFGHRPPAPQQPHDAGVQRRHARRPLAVGALTLEVADALHLGIRAARHEVDGQALGGEVAGHLDGVDPGGVGDRQVHVADHHEAVGHAAGRYRHDVVLDRRGRTTAEARRITTQ